MDRRKKIIPILLGLVGVGIVAKLVYFKSDFRYAGTIEATKVDVPARVTSVISKLNAREGDSVQAGQNLLILTCEDYQLVAQIAKINYVRTERLYRQGSQPREIFDQVKNKWEDSNLKLSWCKVNSPLQGRVLNKYHEPGEMVAPGTKLFTLANIKDVYSYMYVPQGLVSKLSLGMKMTGYLPELGMKAFDGKITEIGEQAEFTPKNVQTQQERTRLVFAIKIAWINLEEILKPGMTIETQFPEI